VLLLLLLLLHWVRLGCQSGASAASQTPFIAMMMRVICSAMCTQVRVVGFVVFKS
jgi:hypothetical protein